MDVEKSLILNNDVIRSKINRIAYEIYERNFGEKNLVLIGIDFRGGFVAEQLAERLNVISNLKLHLSYADRETEELPVAIREEDAARIKGNPVVLVDDVLYSGKTMFHAIAAVMEFGPSKVQNAVLIDRGHRNIPVSPDFVGLVLATTLQQHVSVEVSKNKEVVKAFLA